MSSTVTSPVQVVLPPVLFVRKNTLRSRLATFTDAAGDPLDITSAVFSVRSRGRGKIVLFTATCAVSGGVVTLPEVEDTKTDTWEGIVDWDLRIVLASGASRTYVGGAYDMQKTAQPL